MAGPDDRVFPTELTQLVQPPAVGGAAHDDAAAKMAALLAGPSAQPEPPDPYADDKALLKLFRNLKEEAFDNRWVYERVWWRNLLYVIGRQWIYYDNRRGQWVDKRMARWIPRPVTNKCSETLEAIRSVFGSVQLATKCRPEGNDPVNVSTAETCDNIAPALADEHQMPRVMTEADFWFVTTGNAILHPWWDKRVEKGQFTVPYEACLSCGESALAGDVHNAGGMCPSCGSPMMAPELDEQGQPKVETFANGAGCTDVLSPFEVAFPPSYKRGDDCPYVIRQRWRTKFWCETNLPAEMVDKLQFSTLPDERSLQLLRGLATQTDVGSTPLQEAGGDQSGQEGVVEYELWLKPTKVYAKGLFMRVIGEKGQETVLRLPDEGSPGPLPYVTKQGQPIFPFIHLQYQHIGGRLWGRSPLEDVIQKQDQVNQLDSLVLLIIQRMGNPVWLEPKGSEVKKFTGEPGLVVRYTPVMTAGMAKPEKIEGSNVPMSLIQIRQQLLNDIEMLAGTFDIIKGSKPSGVEAFSALQLLVERSQSRFTLPLAARGEGYRRWFEIALELERQFGPDARTWATLGPNQSWTYESFQNAQLQGAISVVIEDGSQMPKTSLGKRAAVEQLRQMNVLNFQAPDTQYAVVRSFGATELIPSLDYHVKAALQEQDAFERWAAVAQQTSQPVMGPTGAYVVDPMTGQPAVQQSVQPPPVGLGFGRKPWHDDQVHWSEHRKWANGDKVRKLLEQKPFLEQYVVYLIQEHEMAMMQQAMQQAGVAGGAPGEPGGAGRALTNSNNESGNEGDVPSGTGQRADNRGPE